MTRIFRLLRLLLSCFFVFTAFSLFAFYFCSSHDLSALVAPFWDHTSLLADIQSMIEGTLNPFSAMRLSRSGAPFDPAMLSAYFPIPEQLHFAYLKFLSFFSSNPAIIFNLYFIFSFGMIGFCSFYVFRRLQFSFALSFLGSFAFAFLPYHFSRYHQGHLFLANYYPVALAVYGVHLLGRRWNELKKSEKIELVVFSALIGLSHVYYAFFYVLLAWFQAVRSHRKKVFLIPEAKACLVASALVFSAVMLSLAPHLIQRWDLPKSPTVVRHAQDALRYRLRFTHLVFPREDHRFLSVPDSWRPPRVVAADGSAQSIGREEGYDEPIGLLALLGFISVIVSAFRSRKCRTPFQAPLAPFVALSLAVFVYGALGVSYLIAWVFPLIRSPNRISVFLAFLGITLALSQLRRVFSRTSVLVQVGVVTLLMVFVFVDQTSQAHLISQAVVFGDQKTELREFLGELEAELPVGAAVLQLPYVPFPESPRRYEMPDYEHFWAMLYSKSLRFSYGIYRGTNEDRFIASVSNWPIQLQAVKQAGYRCILIDLGGYAPQNRTEIRQSIEAFGQQSGMPVRVSRLQRYLAVSIR